VFLQTVWDTIRSLKPKQLVDDEHVWRELVDRFQEYFAGGMGAEAVEDLIDRLDMTEEEQNLKEVIAVAKSYGASDVRVFGSIARGNITETSDVDLLVRFEPAAP